MNQDSLSDVAPYEYNQEGDSFFVSKDMYDAMVGQCRCGQKKTYAHRVRCLRAPDKPLTVYEQEQKGSKKENQSSNTERPRTSACMSYFDIHYGTPNYCFEFSSCLWWSR